MPDFTATKLTPITRVEQFDSLVERLNQEEIIAVDTESNSLYAYYEQVCLVQFSTASEDFLVDPLALGDLSALEGLFGNPAIEKVFHAAEYDLLCLKRDFSLSFENLFDTMVAARILGREAVGLGTMLEGEFGVQVDKRFQRANWGQRPLPADLLAYARIDTHYLIALRHRLKDELMTAGRWELAQEDFQRLRLVGNQISKENGSGWWRISGAFDLQPQQAAVLAELWRYRDGVARDTNRPAFKVLNDQTLMAITYSLPDNLRSLGGLPGIHERQLQRYGPKILNAVQRGLRAAPVRPPRQPRPDERYLNRLDRLRRWRKATGDQMGVNSDVVLPRDLLLELALKDPHDQAELSEAMQDSPWRLEHFGPQILKALTRT